jgi:competence protein ComEC
VALASWSPQSAAIVVAIVIGDRAALDERVADRLRAAGTYHVVAISGGNIALVVAIAIVIARALTRSVRLSSAAALLAVLAYGGLVGAQPSVTRAVTPRAGAIAIALSNNSMAPSGFPALARIPAICVNR